MIPVSNMRERILITRQQVRTDPLGNHKNVQVPYCRRWAYANRVSGGEEESGHVIREEESLYFVIRFDSETCHITSTGFQIEFRGKTYDITSVDNYKFRNESLTLYVKEKHHD